MLEHHPLSKFLLALLFAAEAYAQTAVAPPGLTLAQAIDQALKNNLQAKLAEERTVESRAQRGIGLSALLPNVSGAAYQMNLTANLAAQGLSASVFPGIPAFIGPFSRFDARLEMVQSLFNLASIRRYRATRYGVQLAVEQRRLADDILAAANSRGGVMGKMISLQSIAVAAAATGMAAAEEARLFRFTLRHSILLATLIGFVVVVYAYVLPGLAP